MADQSRESSQTRRLLFIDPNVDQQTSNEAVRVHVMRESHRARRQLRGMLEWPGRYSRITMFPEAAGTSEPQREVRRRTSEDKASEDPPPAIEEEEESQSSRNDTVEASMLQQKAEEYLASIFKTVSNTAATALKTFRTLRNLPDKIVDLCGEDPAALHALLALIASVRQEIELFQAAEHESRALQALRLRLASYDSTEHSNGTILTILLLFKLEVSRSNDQTASFHESALTRMIQDRGGVETMEKTDRELGALLQNFYSNQTS